MSLTETIDHIRQDCLDFYPKALILFGSAARYLKGLQPAPPKDIDLIHIGKMKPFGPKHYAIDHDLFFYSEDEIISIAKSLRYHPRSISRAKMYMRDTWAGIVRSDIAACLLLGTAYQAYGFLQMENEAMFRDYSVHVVLHGESWWQALQAYAQQHRGLKGLIIDKVHGLDTFQI